MINAHIAPKREPGRDMPQHLSLPAGRLAGVACQQPCRIPSQTTAVRKQPAPKLHPAGSEK